MKFRKIFPLFLLAMVLVVSPFLMATTASATSEQLYIYDRIVLPELPVNLEDYPYSLVAASDFSLVLMCFTTEPAFPDDIFAVAKEDGHCRIFAFMEDTWTAYTEFAYSTNDVLHTAFSGAILWSSFDISSPLGAFCLGSQPVPYSPAAGDDTADPTAGTGIFYQAYNLFSTYIYGVEADALTPDQTLTLTTLATVAALFLVSLPFLIVWRVFFR